MFCSNALSSLQNDLHTKTYTVGLFPGLTFFSESLATDSKTIVGIVYAYVFRIH